MPPLTETYRPATLDDVVGQDAAVAKIRRLIQRGIGGRVLLFQGPSGVGKTSLAWTTCKEIGAAGDEETLQDVTSGRVVSDVAFYKAKEVDQHAAEEMHTRMFLGCWRGRYKVYIIDEAQLITKGAADVLLSVFENIPDHVLVILTTTEESLGEELFGWRSPFGSRCKRIEFDPLTSREGKEAIADRLATIAVMETGNGADIPYAEIVKQGKSNLRACIGLLEDYL